MRIVMSFPCGSLLFRHQTDTSRRLVLGFSNYTMFNKEGKSTRILMPVVMVVSVVDSASTIVESPRVTHNNNFCSRNSKKKSF